MLAYCLVGNQERMKGRVRGGAEGSVRVPSFQVMETNALGV